jgi:aminoglycoside phosphotransferase (APT) family kinase protein
MSGASEKRRSAHGFSDDRATRELLRSRPPEKALAWAGSILGGTVASATALRGGTSSAVHLLGIDLPGGDRAKVVLRRYVRPEINLEESEIAAREARTLEHISEVAVPTPHLLGVEPSGSEAGVPAVLMSHLPGRVDWWPSDTRRWVRRLAELLPQIHAAALPAEGTVPAFTPYEQSSYSPPRMALRPLIWERAFEVFHGSAPTCERVFIQRDFHPGNVLWKTGSVSGVVDWQAACIGPPSIDVGHCRANLFEYGLPVADDFKAAWERLTGRTYDPWAEVVSIVGILDAFREASSADLHMVEEALARALAELGAAS